MFRSFRSQLSGILLMAGLATLLATVLFPGTGQAQAVLPRSGQSFTFGIIDGPYTFTDSASSLASTNLTLTVVSAYSGCGIVTSPSGYEQDFSFVSGSPTVINLPLNLIHLNDLGKTNKGILVHTTQPVNLVLHDYIPYGGDATQILPDGALDTSYVSCGWGIWDDPSDGENDLMEFIVTATSDSTFVTITPSVRTLMNQPDSVPFTVMLNRGECYIVKSDTSDHPSDPSLSGSKIVATKPVSVISGLTCAYVPTGVQACNELMDELIGKKWWGSHFMVQPIDLYDSGGEIVLTSNSNFVAKINANTYNSVNGRIALSFDGNLEIHTQDGQGNAFPVEAHQLSRSYSFCDSSMGDPSLVSVLDISYYADTVLWNTPSFIFSHSVPIICLTSDLGTAKLDGTPLNQLGVNSSVINGSSYSAIDPPVRPGLHKIISPDPIFAISAGFFQADAYSFIPGTAGARQPEDSTEHVVVLQADTARTCTQFDVTGSLGTPIQTTEGVITFTITVTYDPSTLHLVGIVPLTLLTNATYTIDTSIAGTVKISVMGNPLITGDSLFHFVFEAWKTTASTTVALNSGATTICADDSEIITGNAAIFPVLPTKDSLRRQFLLTNSNAVICQPLNLALNTDSIVLPTDGLVLSKIEVFYNPLTEQFEGVSPGSLLMGKPDSGVNVNLGDFRLILTPPALLSGGNSVLVIKFNPQMVSKSDTIRVRVYYLQCGDTLTRDLLVVFPIANNNAYVAPTSLAFDSTITCIPSLNGFLISDSSCEPFTITKISVSGTDWTLLNANGQPLQVPSVVPSYSGLPIFVQFHPTTVGEVQDSITLTYTYSDSTFTRTIALTGFGKAPGGFDYPDSLNFGTASLCLPVSDTLPFTNHSCGKATIDSVRLSQPFSLMSKLPITINSGKSGGPKLEYAPNTVTNDTGLAIITYTVNDSVITDTLTIFGTGKASGTVTPVSKLLTFNNATPCSPDSNIISLVSTSCDTAYIDSIYVTPPFRLSGQLPILFKAPNNGRVPVTYAPDTISSDTGRAIVEVTVNGTIIFDTIKFEGTSKPGGSLQYPPNLFAFGTTSLCSSIDTQIIFSNLNKCYPATIDTIRLAAPFQVLDKPPLTIGKDTTGGFQVRYSPDSNATDTGRAIVTLTVNGAIVYDTLMFIGTGSGGGGANLLSTAVNDSIVITRSECDPLDTVPFYLYNPGCHSLAFTSGFKILSDSAGAWSAVVNPTSSLTARDSVLISLISHDTLPGVYTGFFQTSYLDSNGVEQPFSIHISETITPTARTMALDTAPIDLGTLAPCQTMDIVIPDTNTSCITVNVLGTSLSNGTNGFGLLGTEKFPYQIQKNATDSIRITFDGTHIGTLYDTVVVLFGTDKDSTRRIPIQTFVPPVDSADFLVKMPAKLAPNLHFSAGVYPDRVVSASKGLTSVAGRLSYPDNDFGFDSVTQTAGLQLQKSGPVTVNGRDRVDFSVSNPNGFALDPATPIVQIWLKSMLTDSINYSITLDSLVLNGGDPSFSQCTLAATGTTTSAQFSSSCGDSLIIESLQGRPLIYSTLPTPNPVGEDEGYMTEIDLHSYADGIAEIELCDALGRTISRENFSLQTGETVPCSLDLRNSPAGSYFYTIRYQSQFGTTAKNGSILLIR
jgi:hypothetical protein